MEEPMSGLRLRGVEKRYDRFRLGPIDLEIGTGEVMGLEGSNGAGKSTLLRVAAGLLRVDAGSTEFDGRRLTVDTREAKGWFGFVSDDLALYPDETVAWHLEICRRLLPRWDVGRALSLLDRFELDPLLRARSLSRGQTRKAILTMALARRPRLLILDEPTEALDAPARVFLLGELRRMAAAERVSVLLASHLADDFAALDANLVRLSRGQFVAQSTWSAA